MVIITSLLDTDLYKLTMQQVVLHQFSGTEVEYAFKCRNVAIWNQQIVKAINEELDALCSLRFTAEELVYLRSIRFLKKDYLDFLSLMQLNRNHIYALLDNKDNLEIRIRGSWLLTILFEVPVLAIVNEVYNRYAHPNAPMHTGEYRLQEKLKLVPEDMRFSDFGTRRRFSKEWQKSVISNMRYAPRGTFTGSSNVWIAKHYGITPIGTMAHEFIQCGQAIGVRLIDSQKRMLQAWVDEYRGDLGIALTDTLGVDAFLRDFDLYFSKLYDGVRHDSGDPIPWGHKMIAHYEKMKIDPMSKTLVFSDSLTIPKANEILDVFRGKAKVSFGIGTNLTNDIEGVNPLNIVIKVIRCNGSPVAKISDSVGKGMCEDENYVTYLKSVFGIKE
jgi:nicotinate phosphoribosyltransferase